MDIPELKKDLDEKLSAVTLHDLVLAEQAFTTNEKIRVLLGDLRSLKFGQLPKQQNVNFLELQTTLRGIQGGKNVSSRIKNAAQAFYYLLYEMARKKPAPTKESQPGNPARDTRGGKEASNGIQEQLMMKEVAAQGRMVAMTSVDETMVPRTGEKGFQFVADARMPVEARGYVTDATNDVAHSFGQDVSEFLRRQDVPAAVSLSPVEYRYQEQVPVTDTRSFVSKFLTSAPQPTFVEKIQRLTMSVFNGNSQDTRPASRINLMVLETNDSPRRRYAAPDGGRSGNRFYGSIILPQDLAEKAYATFQNKPALALEYFRAVDPALMNMKAPGGKPAMPEIDRIFVHPLGQNPSAPYTFDAAGQQCTGIKPQYVLKVTK